MISFFSVKWGINVVVLSYRLVLMREEKIVNNKIVQFATLNYVSCLLHMAHAKHMQCARSFNRNLELLTNVYLI